MADDSTYGKIRNTYPSEAWSANQEAASGLIFTPPVEQAICEVSTQDVAQVYTQVDTDKSKVSQDSTVSPASSGKRNRPGRKRSMLEAIVDEKKAATVKPNEQIVVEATHADREHANSSWHCVRREDAYRSGESRFPLLQTTVDELAAMDGRSEGNHDSSSSTSYKSPSSFYGTSFDSPYVFSSPIETQKSRRQTQSNDTPAFSSTMLRRTSRNGSTRTGSASSAAGQFLAGFRRENTIVASKPDDEGQELGDNGEYVIGKQIGRGGFSVVKEVHTFEHGAKTTLALKIVRKHIDGQNEENNERAQSEFEREVKIWRLLKYENILPLITVFDTPFATFCVTQLSAGGTLYDVVLHYRRQASKITSPGSPAFRPRTSSNLTQIGESSSGVRSPIPLSMAKRYIFQLASALRYLHQDIRIVHRDVKLENCLVNIASPNLASSVPSLASASSAQNMGRMPSETNPGNILLSDFGLSDWISSDERDPRSASPEKDHNAKVHGGAVSPPRSSTPIIGPGPNSSGSVDFAGSLPYASPEQLQSKVPLYQPSVDIWAFGVICYALLTGQLPFKHALPQKVVEMIEKGNWNEEIVKNAVGSHAKVYNADNSEAIDYADEEDTELDDALALLRGCMHLDRTKRWDVKDVLACHFLHAGEAKCGVGSETI